MSRPATSRDEPGFAVYVHWPFCAQKCPYCDFNSHVRHGGWDEARYLAALKAELDHLAGLTGPRNVSSIFLGGGTPSLMQPATVAAVLDHIARLWTVERAAEVTIEANPGSVEAGRFAGYRAAGVNRASLGIQSLRDEELTKLGRIHTAAEAKAALAIARSTFERVSFDLIYARSGQTTAAWRDELAEALAMAEGHLSLYQLTIEPETPFAALHALGKLHVPDGDLSLALYEITQEMTDAAGLPAYEISNHAAPGEECRHNLVYWRYGEYAGAGPGAHGRLLAGGTRLATTTERNPEAWASRVEKEGHGLNDRLQLTRAEEADEFLLMGLRLAEGIDLTTLERTTSHTLGEDVVSELIGHGLLERIAEERSAAGPLDEYGESDDVIRSCIGPGLAPVATRPEPRAGAERRIRATPRGRLVLNQILYKLSASLGPSASPGRF